MEEQGNQLEVGVSTIGEELLVWDVDEFTPHQRSRLWYLVMGVLGVIFIVYAIVTANFLFAIIILMGGIILLIANFKEPDQVPVTITNLGIAVGAQFYEYKTLKDFSIVYDPPETKLLYLDFNSITQPMLAIPIEDQNPNLIRELLLPFCLENLERTDENLTDLIRRVYKL